MSYKLFKKKDRLGVYNFYLFWEGQQYRKRVTCLPAYIERIHNDWLNSIYNREAFQSPSIGKAVDDYFIFTAKTKSPKENVKIKLWLGQLLMFKPRKVADLRPADIQTLFSKYEYANPHTHNRRMNVISAFFHWCDLQGFPPKKNLLYGFRKKTPESRPVLLTSDQIRLMFSRTHFQHQRTFLLLALFTGMRHGEIVNIKWSDINFNDSYIHLPGSRTKNNRSRIIPLIPQLKNYLSKIKRECDYVVSFAGKQVTTFIRSWKTIGKDICRIHDLRHHFATVLLTAGVPIRVAQEALGHSSCSITEKYSALTTPMITETITYFDKSFHNMFTTDIFSHQNSSKIKE